MTTKKKVKTKDELVFEIAELRMCANRRKPRYCIIWGHCLETGKFCKTVNDHLEDGWKLHGPLIVGGDACADYHQAMTKNV